MIKLTDWMASKGLVVAEGAIRAALDVPSFESLVKDELRLINNKLDVLLNAPYKQALMHLKEGELEKCKNKVIEAVTLNELDLPARILYIYLLRYEEKYELALEYYWDLMERFGFRLDLIPAPILKMYSDWYFQSAMKDLNAITQERDSVFGRKGGAYHEGDNFYPRDIWCTPDQMVILWRSDRSFFGRAARLFLKSFVGVRASTWEGHTFIDQSYWFDRRIAMVTAKYFVLEDNKSTYTVYWLSDRDHHPQQLSHEQFTALFTPYEEELVKKCRFQIENYEEIHKLYFGGAIIRTGTYYRVEDEYMELGRTPSGGGGGAIHWKSKHKGGTMRIAGERTYKLYPVVLDFES